MLVSQFIFLSKNMVFFTLELIYQLIIPIILITTVLIMIRIRNWYILLSNLPPGETGWPVIGETKDFKNSNMSSNPENFIYERMNKFNTQVFKTSLFGEKMVVFCGANGNKLLFLNEYKLVSSWWPKSMKIALNFPKKSPNREELNKKRRFLHDILKPDSLRSYVGIMDSMAREHLEQEWAPHTQVKIFPLLKKYTFELACRIFLGIEDPKRASRFGDQFAVLRAGYMSVPINLPGTTLNRSVKAGKNIRKELQLIIKERKNKISENSGEFTKADLLSSMLMTSDENGKFMSENEISSQIMGSLIASHHTTSTAISFVVMYFAQLPLVYEQVFGEQKAISESKSLGELLNWDDIQKMKYSWNVASEAMRLSPPAQGAFREVITDFTYEGFTIPKGWKTYWSTYSTHKNPQYFKDPENFDPSRFEGSGPEPYTYVPFGGGPRICPGKEYARLEILVFIHNVVTRFKLEKVNKDDVSLLNSTTIARDGLPIRLRLLR